MSPRKYPRGEYLRRIREALSWSRQRDEPDDAAVEAIDLDAVLGGDASLQSPPRRAADDTAVAPAPAQPDEDVQPSDQALPELAQQAVPPQAVPPQETRPEAAQPEVPPRVITRKRRPPKPPAEPELVEPPQLTPLFEAAAVRRMVAFDRLNWRTYAAHRATRSDIDAQLVPAQVETLARAAYADGQARGATDERGSPSPESSEALLRQLGADHPVVPEAAVAGWCAGVGSSTLTDYVRAYPEHVKDPVFPPLVRAHSEDEALQLSYGIRLRITHLAKNAGRNPWVSKAKRSANFIIDADSMTEDWVQRVRGVGDYETAIAINAIKLPGDQPGQYPRLLSSCEQAGAVAALYGPNSFHTVFVPDDVDVSSRSDDRPGSNWLAEVVERGQHCDALVFYRGTSTQPHPSVAQWQAPVGVTLLRLPTTSLSGLHLGKLHATAAKPAAAPPPASTTRRPISTSDRASAPSDAARLVEHAGSGDAEFAVMADMGLWGFAPPWVDPAAEFSRHAQRVRDGSSEDVPLFGVAVRSDGVTDAVRSWTAAFDRVTARTDKPLLVAVPAWNPATRDAVVKGLYHSARHADGDVLRVAGVVALRDDGKQNSRYRLPSSTDLMYVDDPDWLADEQIMAELKQRTAAILAMRELVETARGAVGEQAVQWRRRLITPDGEPIAVSHGVRAAAAFAEQSTRLQRDPTAETVSSRSQAVAVVNRGCPPTARRIDVLVENHKPLHPLPPPDVRAGTTDRATVRVLCTGKVGLGFLRGVVSKLTSHSAWPSPDIRINENSVPLELRQGWRAQPGAPRKPRKPKST